MMSDILLHKKASLERCSRHGIITPDHRKHLSPEIISDRMRLLLIYTEPASQEIIRVRNKDTLEIEEQWSGDYIFENEWQSFRTKKDCTLERKSVAHECPPGRCKFAVKIVDIFGNDTMKIVEV